MPGSPLQVEKARTMLRLGVALLGVFLGVRAAGTNWAMLAFPLVVISVWSAANSFGRLMRLRLVESELLARARADFARQFRRSTLPRQVYWLLLAVAETDGEAGGDERGMVRQFVLERFADADLSDLAQWEAGRIERGQVTLLAASIRAVISASEAETIFFWACLVAFADRQFNAGEHETLHQIAQGLGIHAMHARRIFLHARQAFVGGADEQRSRRQGTQPPPRGRPGARQRALQILGLDGDADAAAIRRRHRELAKAHHPDRHLHLGEKAAREAAARFREIQAAYEVLRT